MGCRQMIRFPFVCLANCVLRVRQPLCRPKNVCADRKTVTLKGQPQLIGADARLQLIAHARNPMWIVADGRECRTVMRRPAFCFDRSDRMVTPAG